MVAYEPVLYSVIQKAIYQYFWRLEWRSLAEESII